MHDELHEGLIFSYLKFLGPEVHTALQGLFLETILALAGPTKTFTPIFAALQPTLPTMTRISIFALCAVLVLSSCVGKKKYVVLQGNANKATEELNACNTAKAALEAKVAGLESTNDHLKDQVRDLNNTNAALLNNVGNMATLSAKEAENLEKSLESMREKDLQIKNLNDALTKKDSVTIALVTSLKGVLGNMDDKDVEINVEKGVVFISISDKMLFTSGSYVVTDNAKVVLGKVATVINNKPEMDVLIEGHTDDVPVSKQCISDNWDLSVLRATAIVRVLQKDFNVAPSRLTAGGRSQYVPLVANDTPENKATNRRTRVVILPKLDQFYEMIEEGMKEASEESK